jgi:hypothetical protein
MLTERNIVKEFYWEQGFMGRFLIYLVDQMIIANLASAELII